MSALLHIMGNNLNQAYPKDKYITGEKLYQYLHISKRKMKFLLDNKYVHYIDTGKKTHRYIIKIEDAEELKKLLESDIDLQNQLHGKFSSNIDKEPKKELITADSANCKEFKTYLAKIWREEPDAIPTKRAAELTGFAPQCLYRFIESDKLFAVKVKEKVYISKDSMIKYFSSKERLGKPYSTEGYSKLIEKFIEYNVSN